MPQASAPDRDGVGSTAPPCGPTLVPDLPERAAAIRALAAAARTAVASARQARGMMFDWDAPPPAWSVHLLDAS